MSANLAPTAVEAPNQFVAVNGRRIAYRSIGAGRPLILCVRFRGKMDSWFPAFLDALASNGIRVTAFDHSYLWLSSGAPSYNPNDIGQAPSHLIK